MSLRAVRRQLPTILAAAATTVALTTTTLYALDGAGTVDADFTEARAGAAPTANLQRDLQAFHLAVVRLRYGGSLEHARLHQDLAIQQLRALARVAPDRPIGELQRLVLRADLATMAATDDGGRALRRYDLALSNAERRFKVDYDERERRFDALIAETVAHRRREQQLLVGLVLLTLALVVGWIVSVRRRASGDVARANRTARRAEARFASVVRQSTDLTLLADPDGRIEYASPAAAQLTGRDADELVGMRLAEVVHVEDLPSLATLLSGLAATPDEVQHRALRLAGPVEVAHVDVTATNLLDDPDVGALVLNLRDVTARHQLEEELSHLAFHDALTGLPNRALLRDRIEHAAAVARRSEGTGIGVLLIDLDDFKGVNDGLGHDHGDLLLIDVAHRLRNAVRAGDTVARLGGDEFVVLVEGVQDDPEVLDLADRLTDALDYQASLWSHVVPVSASIGVRIARGADVRAEDLLRDADLAMYRAKADGKGAWARFEDAMHDDASEQLQLRAELHRALVDGQFVVHYQPIVDAQTLRIVALEALIRWQHPTRGLIMPGAFMDVAERSGLVAGIGEDVLREAIRALGRLQRASARPWLRMSINVSPRQLEGGGVAEALRASCLASGVAADRVVAEVTETVFLADTDGVRREIDAIRALGVELALDDFGTGFSSLSYIERLPLDALKIDRSFLASMVGDGSRNALVATIVRLGDILGLRTIAEGVESEEQLAVLREMGCGALQGYLFGRPMTEDAVREVLLAEEPEDAPVAS